MIRQKQFFFMYAFIVGLSSGKTAFCTDTPFDGTPETVSSISPDIQLQAELKKILEQELKITIELDAILSDILIQCGNGTIRTKNPDQHINGITQVRDTIEKKIEQTQGRVLLQGTQFSPLEVAHANHFNATLLNAVDELINANFEKPIALLATRALPTDDALDLAQLQEQSADNNACFKDIQALSASAGLSWYNTLYRKIRPYTIAPAQRHALLLEATAAVTLMGAYVLHQIPQEKVTNTILNKIKAPLGDSPQAYIDSSPDGRPIIVNDPSNATTGLGQAIAWLNRFMSPNDPIGSKLFNFVSANCVAGYAYARPKIAEKCTELDNFLLGGVHRKQNTLSAYVPKTRLTDIVGMETEKEQAELLIQSILEPEKFARSGATPPSTVLFIGGSRAGKTYFAEAIGGEIAHRTGNDAFFFKVRPGHIMEFGFEGLMYQAQCYNIRVLFIDEFHRYFKNGSNQDMLNGALTALNQNYDPKNPVVVICATNDPASLPHDLRNRFEVIVRFGKTTLSDRAQYLERELRKSGIKLEESSFAQLVYETHNCSFESLQRLIKAAKRDALTEKEAVAEKHIWRAFDKEIRGIILDDTKTISPATEVIVAANIAAETLVRIVSEGALEEEVSATTIRAYNASIQESSLQEQWWATTETVREHKRYGKVFARELFDNADAIGFERQKAQCKALLAGYVGEAAIMGECGYGYRPELRNKALKIALGIVSRGTNLQEVASEIRAQYERDALEYLKNLETEISTLLEQYEAEFVAIMLMLRQYKTLYREQLLACTTKEIAQNIFADFQQQMAQAQQELQPESPDSLPAQPEGLEVVLPAT